MLMHGVFTRKYSHHPYSCDDEDRQADGKDHPQRHDGRQAISAANDTNGHRLRYRPEGAQTQSVRENKCTNITITNPEIRIPDW